MPARLQNAVWLVSLFVLYALSVRKIGIYLIVKELIYIILQSRRGRRPRRPEFVTLRWRYFWRKSNQNVGVAIPPLPNAAQVWNAPSATNHGIPPSLITFSRQRILS